MCVWSMKIINICVEYFIVPIYGDLESSDTVFPEVKPAAKEALPSLPGSAESILN